MINAYIEGFVSKTYHTESAGTVIDEEIPGRDGQRLALIGVAYKAAVTAHVMSLMHAGGTRTEADAEAAGSQKVLVCKVAPKDPAGNVAANGDIVAYKLTTGVWEFNLVDSLATKTITFVNDISDVVKAGASIRVYGVVGDGACSKLSFGASAVTERYDAILALNPFKGDPFYVTIDNATNAGFLHNLLFGYINK